MHLVYIADPLCPWCHAFARSVRSCFDSRPAAAEPPALMFATAGAPAPRDVAAHWAEVAAQTGMPLSPAALALAASPSFRVDVDAPRRALVTVRALAPQRTWTYLQAMQEALFGEGRDITRPEVLAALGDRIGLMPPLLLTAATGAESGQVASHDQQQVRGWGVSRTPTLLLEHAGQLQRLADGYVSPSALQRRLADRGADLTPA